MSWKPGEPLIHSVEAVGRHRNGICGEPFYVVLFTDAQQGRPMLATVFDAPEPPDPLPVNPRVAVLSLLHSIRGDATDCYRGDNFAPELYRAIADYEAHWRTTEGLPPVTCYIYRCPGVPVARDAEGLGFCAHHAGSDCVPLENATTEAPA